MLFINVRIISAEVSFLYQYTIFFFFLNGALEILILPYSTCVGKTKHKHGGEKKKGKDRAAAGYEGDSLKDVNATSLFDKI